MSETDRIPSNRKILYVEDEEVTRNTVIHLIKRRYPGATILSAVNGKEGLEMFRDERPDLVITDIVMPVMDGIEATRRIIEARPDERIIVLTSYSGDEKLFPAIKAGALGYLVKDAQPEELVQSIRNVYLGEPSLNPSIAWNLLWFSLQ